MQVKRQRLAARPEIILEAAAAVLLKGGVRGLTIDAVAVEAGLSKGGVLHHYASKDALVAALVGGAARRLGGEAAQISSSGGRDRDHSEFGPAPGEWPVQTRRGLLRNPFFLSRGLSAL